MLRRLLQLLFPPKCIFCQTILEKEETDLCHNCRISIQEHGTGKRNIQFIAKWTALWYYNGDIRQSIHRYKFYHYQSYSKAYGRFLAMHLLQSGLLEGTDFLTWTPTSFLRRISRGYDQSKEIALEASKHLNIPAVCTLVKHRHTPPQSTIKGMAQRRANILGAYHVSRAADIRGKRILLIDDILTTGCTATECAKTLSLAGAKEIKFAALAAASHDK